MSQTPIKLRNRKTLGNDSSLYNNIVNTPIGKQSNSKGSECTDALPRRQTRQSSRNQQVPSATVSEKDESESTCSNDTNNSNVENENIVRAKKKNEITPLRNKLTRNRRSVRSSSFVVESSINDQEKSIKCTFRKQSTTETLTPKQRPLRSNRRSTYYDIYDSLSDDDEDEKPEAGKRNASYFSKKDFEDYRPECEEDEPPTSSEDEAEENVSSDGENSETSSSEDEVQATPPKRSLIMQDLTKLALTPELLNKLEGRNVRRRLGVNSPVATGSQTMSPNPETYFLAENRVKFRSTIKQPEVMNDAMKGKRRRKRKITVDAESRLPEKIPTDFSVTTEAIRATVNPDDFKSGNTHEEKVEELFRNIVDNEFPHWLGLFRDGFNVMLYGYGSKLSIFKEFEEFVNNHYLTISINGLFPKLVARKLLYGVIDYVSPDAPVPHGLNLEAVAKDAVKVLKTVNHSDIFILINNFDSLALRFPQILSILCWLSQVPYIHILASCDTVNAFLGVTQSQALQLNFCWMHCPTYKSYREELKWIPGIYGDETKVVTQKSSLKYVLQSLTGNAKKAFALLAQMQSKQMKSRAVQKAKEAYAGVRFQELAKACREKFIAHSDENLRTLLVEFFDHKLIRQTGKGKHLENTLLIELDLETLDEIISELT